MSEMHTNQEVEKEAKTSFWKDPEWRKAAKETAIETGVTLIVGIGIQVTIGLASQAIIKEINKRFMEDTAVKVNLLTVDVKPEVEA